MSGFDELTTPCAIEFEQSVIGALLIDNAAIDNIGELRAEHFFRADHRTLFAEVRGMLNGGAQVDAITLYQAMHAKGTADAVGGLSYINSLVQNTPGASNIRRYADGIRDRAQLRGLVEVANGIKTAVDSTNGATAAELIDTAAARLEKLSEASIRQEPKSAADAMGEHCAALQRRSEGTERVISTGIDALDRQLNGGLRPGWVVILAARPGMGKTAAALNIATHVSKMHAALFLSLEMPESELCDRNIASLGRVPLDRVMRMEADDDECWTALTVAALKLKESTLHIDDQAALTMADVRAKARAMKRKHGLDLIVIDYLQLMTGEGFNRNAEIEGISRGLKALAKELGCAILALAQLNRKVEERTSRLPMLSDLRDSGSIEQDADAVIFIHREIVSNPDAGEQWDSFAQMRVAKFRHGRTGDIGLTYRGDYMTFEAWAGPFPTNEAENRPKRRTFE